MLGATCSYVVCFACGAAAASLADGSDPPWQSLINAGAAGLVLLTVVLFMRFLREQRLESKEEREAQRKDFTEALRVQRGEFTDAMRLQRETSVNALNGIVVTFKESADRTENALEKLTNEIRSSRGSAA